MRYKFLTNEISNAIVDILSDFDFLVVCQKGDLLNLPAPEQFKNYMPMCLVNASHVTHGENDLNPQVTGNIYYFVIRYLEYFDSFDDLYQIREQAMDRGQQIAEKLSNTNLQNSFNDPRIMIQGQKVEFIDFDSSEKLVFRNLNLPVELVEIHFTVYAITY